MKLRAALLLLLTLFVVAPVMAAKGEKSADPEAEEFRSEIQKIVKELEGGSDASFLKALDRRGPVKDASDSIDADETGFFAAANEAVAEVGREFVRRLNRCGISKVVRVRRAGESVFALVRFDYGDAGWGWADMELAPGLDGSMRVVDVINHSTALNLQETAKLAGSPHLIKEESISKLYGFPVDSPELDSIIAMLDALRSGDYADGVQEYYRMAGNVRARKDVAFLALRAAELAGNPISWFKIMAEIGETLGEEKSLTLFLAEFNFMANEAGKALARIEEFEKREGVRDATLLAMKAQAACELGRQDMAHAFASQSLELGPDLRDGYWAVFQCHVAAYNYEKAVSYAKILEDRFDYRMDEELLGQSDFYNGFVHSRDYTKWRQGLEAQ